ncbi:MAG: glycoside hydrolase [Anaerolineaceae bacterium]|nr:MAG: glycoside hydrolase [Anaerolineaceae bacterium]
MRKSMKKLVLIGGGSVRTYYFVESLIKFHERLGIDRLYIMDIDAERLSYFGGMALHLIKRSKSKLKVVLTDQIVEAVEGADYVVTTIRVGMDEARCRDERIALDLNLIGQETTGAGGFSYAIRTIPLILDYMRIIKQHAKPNVTVFNFTNPSGLVTQAIYDAGFDGVVGICDNATGIKIDISDALKIDASDIVVKVYGLNHLSWANSVEIGGVNILPRLLENEGFVQNFRQFHYFDRDLVRSLGEIPNGYLYYYYHRDKALSNLLASPLSRGESIRDINYAMMEELRKHSIETEAEQCISIYRDYMHRREGSYMSIEMGGESKSYDPIDVESLGITELIGRNSSHEVYEGYAGVVFNYIDSVNNKKNIDLAISVPNGRAIPEMAPTDVVEVTCNIGVNGFTPMNFENINPTNLILMQTIKRYEKLTVEAVREKNIEKAIEALTIHPLISDYSLAKRLVKEYVKLNEPYIGVWK